MSQQDAPGSHAPGELLDAFGLTFPLPFRVGYIITLAVWGWGLNLHGLHLCKIDVPTLIRYPGRSSPQHISHHLSTYRLAIVLSALFSVSICLFWLLTWHVPSRVVAFDWLPMTYLTAFLAVFLVPFRNLPSGGRRRLLSTLRRICVGGLAQAQEGKFADILLADVLTSYAKVFGDVFVMMCMFLSPGASATDRPDRSCGGRAVAPLLMAVPSAIRLRQCIIEYLRVRRAPYKESTGWGGRHLANALKYSTAFPVLLFSCLQRGVQEDHERLKRLNRLWLVAVTVNSLYAFYWDVANDWDLTLFSPRRERASPHHRWGLRSRLAFRSAGLYYTVIALDLVLRCSWSMKLSPHLSKFSDFESGIFLIELFEVFRRWVWMFFRVETEWIRHLSTTGLPVGTEEILLDNYQGKHDNEE
ncbi:Protein ERD1 -like protein 1 [Escovopsis weberi]|uniref:Protein ERD1-like protein 1 n=1 Tax=Escovopsis weberi TaxID=150374 RepID=A0A0N0RTF7_ESCWE|nr:Protein ERD1 -like protein 1 [Escovopsis weberi]